MIRQDYVVRLIEQCAEVLRRMMQQREQGQLEPALQTLREAEERLLGKLLPVIDRLEPASAVEVAGAELVLLYASLLGEEGLIHQARLEPAQAHLASRRSAELYAAASLAGRRLLEPELRRVALLLAVAGVEGCDPRYAEELRRIQILASTATSAPAQP